MLFEYPLPVGFLIFPPVDIIVENIVQKFLVVPKMLKFSIEELNK